MRSAGARGSSHIVCSLSRCGGAGRGAGAGEAQDNPAAPAAPATTRSGRRAAGGRRNFHSRRARKAAGPDRPLSRPLARAAPARERLPGADRPGAALARQEPGARRQQRLFRDRQPELGSCGEGARALSGRHQDDERGSRLDDGPRRRRGEPAPGRRRRHPGASRQGATDRRSQDDRATDGHDHPATGHDHERGSAQESYIEIQPTDPATVYVPSYDPVSVYQPYSGVAPLLGFGAGIAVGALWNNNYWNWGSGAIYPPSWAGYPGWRPPYAGWRPGQPVCPGGRCGNINNGTSISEIMSISATT